MPSQNDMYIAKPFLLILWACAMCMVGWFLKKWSFDILTGHSLILFSLVKQHVMQNFRIFEKSLERATGDQIFVHKVYGTLRSKCFFAIFSLNILVVNIQLWHVLDRLLYFIKLLLLKKEYQVHDCPEKGKV